MLVWTKTGAKKYILPEVMQLAVSSEDTWKKMLTGLSPSLTPNIDSPPHGPQPQFVISVRELLVDNGAVSSDTKYELIHVHLPKLEDWGYGVSHGSGTRRLVVTFLLRRETCRGSSRRAST